MNITICQLQNEAFLYEISESINISSCIVGEWAFILQSIILSILAGIFLGAVLGFIKKN